MVESISLDHLDVLTFTLKAVEEAARQMERAIGAKECVYGFLAQQYKLVAGDGLNAATGQIQRAAPTPAAPVLEDA